MYAALADSIVDLLSQVVLSLASKYMSKYHYDYPVGRSKLEALSVLACSGIMFITSVEVLQFSAQDLVVGFSGNPPTIKLDNISIGIVAFGIISKAVLYAYCHIATTNNPSDQLDALAEDHLNDVFANIGALVSAAIAARVHSVWWLDPVSAIVISVIIMYRWSSMIAEQVKKIIGYTAPPEFITLVNDIAKQHDDRILLDCTRAYHFGSRFNVEMEIVLPADMSVRESHDIALALQHKIEELDDVERAFVHVDHETRDGLEHKIERALVSSHKSNLQAVKDDEYVPVGIRLRNIAGIQVAEENGNRI